MEPQLLPGRKGIALNSDQWNALSGATEIINAELQVRVWRVNVMYHLLTWLCEGTWLCVSVCGVGHGRRNMTDVERYVQWDTVERGG